MVTVRLFSSVEDVACAVLGVLERFMMVGLVIGTLAIELEIFLVVVAVEDAHQPVGDGGAQRGSALGGPGVGEKLLPVTCQILPVFMAKTAGNCGIIKYKKIQGSDLGLIICRCNLLSACRDMNSTALQSFGIPSQHSP